MSYKVSDLVEASLLSAPVDTDFSTTSSVIMDTPLVGFRSREASDKSKHPLFPKVPLLNNQTNFDAFSNQVLFYIFYYKQKHSNLAWAY